jgi:vacuolar protein sorting-associated protein 13A/C
MVGMVDLATNVTEGIRNTTTVFDDNDVSRVRFTRHVGRDKIIRVYDQRKAYGQNLVRNASNGRFAGDEYIAHIELREDDRAVVLTDQRILCIRLQNTHSEWEVPFSRIRNVSLNESANTVTITLTGEVPSYSFAVRSYSDPRVLAGFCTSIEERLHQWNLEHRELE